MRLSTKEIVWREYQRELLAQFDELKRDSSIHLVAPPGSGKTLLGIELARLYCGKTLILVPSLALKQQWKKTLISLYEDASLAQSEMSERIDEPALITIETYQKFYQWEARADFDIDVLVLDEAHHLKRSWADAVLALKGQLPKLATISLTATPPFESDVADWRRYMEVSGNIDAEISIPSLIKEDVLAPHQDFVYLIPGTVADREAYLAHEEEQNRLFQLLLADDELCDFFIHCDFIQAPENLEPIYQSFDVYQSALILLWHRNYDLGEAHWQLLGVTKKQGEAIGIPPLTVTHLEVLANYVATEAPELAISQLVNQKRVAQEKWVNVFSEYAVNRLENALGKKEAIRQIIMREAKHLKEALSAVILVDYIKAEAIESEQDSFGLFPLFNYLMALMREERLQLAAICGDWLVLPKELYDEDFAHWDGKPYANHQDYLLMPIKGNRSQVLEVVTALVNRKKIQVLIGTVALLGEGWDCPGINCLILSNQGNGFVQTQQLRGRSLRRGEGKEAAAIWHLSIVLPEVASEKQIGLKKLSKRLDHIVGVTFEQDGVIENGPQRFEFPFEYTAQTVEVFNEKMLFWSSQKSDLKVQWQRALGKGRHLRQAVVTRYQEPVPKSVTGWKASQQTTGIPLVAKLALVAVPVSLLAVSPLATFGAAVVSGLLGGALTQKTKIQQQWANYQAEKAWQKQMKLWESGANSVYQTMVELKLIQSSAQVRVSGTAREISCTLEGGLKKEETAFNRAVEELFQGLAMPRYLICHKEECWPVPTLFGQNKASALVFMENWQTQFNQKVTLRYTRNQEGRRLLIQHKLKELTKGQTVEILRQDLWSN